MFTFASLANIKGKRFFLPSLLTLIFLALLTVTWSAGDASGSVGAGPFTRVSTATPGINEANCASRNDTVSADGRYIAFSSCASNFLLDDVNGKDDVFVKDTRTGSISLVSSDSSGNQVNGHSGQMGVAISADGNYIAFDSAASNLVAGDANNASDVFLKNMQTGAVSRVSTDSAGAEVNGASPGYSSISISADGRYVVFDSLATNLVAGDVNDAADVFLKDTVTGTTTLVSANSSGQQGYNGPGGVFPGSGGSAISADGRYVAFSSQAHNLVSGTDQYAGELCYRKDTQTGAVNIASQIGNNVGAYCSSISADGRYVAFTQGTTFTNNGYSEPYVMDMQNSAITPVYSDSMGTLLHGVNWTSGISADGRFASFISQQGPIVSGIPTGIKQAYIKDLQTEALTMVSRSAGGSPGDGDSTAVSFAGDGLSFVMESAASNLVSGDTNNAGDIFKADWNLPAVDTNYYFPWYDSVFGRTWVLTAQPFAGSEAAHENTFDVSLRNMNSGMMDLLTPGGIFVNQGQTGNVPPSGMMGGPVRVTSHDGEGLVSERSLFGNSFEEVWGTPYANLDTHYWWPVYDGASAGMRNWILAANPPESLDNITVRVTVHNASPDISETRDLAPGESWTPIYSGRFGGPVEVKAWKQDGNEDIEARKVIASQRVLYNGAFNEMPGIGNANLASMYLWTWYDNQNASNWIDVANPGPDWITASVVVGNPLNNPVFIDHMNIAPNQTYAFRKPGMGGPVYVIGKILGTQTDSPIVASQRVLWGPSFGELAGTSFSDISYTTSNWTWYDQSSPGVTNWVLIANPAPDPIYAEARIAGVTIWGGVVEPFGNKTPTFPGRMGGSVQVESWKSETDPVTGAQLKQHPYPAFASQRVLWNGYFNEIVGKGM